MFDLISGPTLLAYVGLVLAIAIAPGPNVIFVMTQSAWRGSKAGLFAAAGVETANSVYVLCSAAGIASLIAASSAAFEIIKWAGAAYLVWLGFQAIRSSFSSAAPSPLTLGEASSRAYRDGLMIGAGNPKTILFFLALFPQFIDPTHTIWMQSLILGAIAVILDFMIQCLYIALGGMLSRALSRGPVKRWFERSVGGAFMGLAFAAALVHRS